MNRFLQHVHVADVARAIRRLDKGVVLGHALPGVLIGVLLAYFRQHIQPPAGANIGGFQGQTLGLGRFDGHGHKSSRNWARRRAAAGPRPPSILASSRTPICRSSMRARTDARSFTSSRKSTRPSAVKKNKNLVPLKAALHPAPASSPGCLEDLPLADIEGFPPGCGCGPLCGGRSPWPRGPWARRGWMTQQSSTGWLPMVHWAYSGPGLSPR